MAPAWLARTTATITTLLEEGAPPKSPAGGIDSVEAEVAEVAEVAAMLRAFGIALLESSQATNDIRTTVLGIASAYGIDDARVVVLPTVVFVQLPGDTANRTEIESIHDEPLRLDQLGALSRLVRLAETGTLEPAEMMARLAEIRAAKPRFGWKLTFVGYIILTLGFGLSLDPTDRAVPAYLLLGAMVGAMILLGRRLDMVATVLPVLAAFSVTMVTALFLVDAVGYDPFELLAPPLVSFLPGLTMTIAAVELTSDEVVAGASRVLYGLSQLLLLGFGVFAAFTIVGEITPGTSGQRLGSWAGWVGVLLTAAGYVLFSSAPRGAFLWLVACLYVTVAAQHLGNVLLSPELSGFVGALVVVPFTAAVGRWKSAPPTIVMLIPAFWLLVPGALGFIGISQAASETYDGSEALVATTLALLSIALGILVGTGIARNTAAVRRTWREARP